MHHNDLCIHAAVTEQFPVVSVVLATILALLVRWTAHQMETMLQFQVGVTSIWHGNLVKWVFYAWKCVSSFEPLCLLEDCIICFGWPQFKCYHRMWFWENLSPQAFWQPHNRAVARRIQNMGWRADGGLWLLVRGGGLYLSKGTGVSTSSQ